MPPARANSRAVETDAPRQRRLAAIAFADIVGYSILMSEDEGRTHARWMYLLKEVIRPAALDYGGNVIKSTGDGVLAEFTSAMDAVEWAQEVQRQLQSTPVGKFSDGPPIAFRIAVHLGDVYSAAGDIFGDGVNVTARLQEYAEPGGIVMSEAIFDSVRGNLGTEVHDLGPLKLKNLAKPIRAYALSPKTSSRVPQVRTDDSGLPSIAILPLENMSGDPADDYFAEGIVEDIVVSLAGLRELRVISRASTVVYRGQRRNLREIGRELAVRYVMTGSVRRSPQIVRVSAQLCDAQTGASVWAETSEVPPAELFEVQDRLVWRIVAGIAPHVRAEELHRALRKRPDSFTAYDHTLRALNVINSLNADTFGKAREFLEKALAEDAHFSMAAAWLARWFSINIGQGWAVNRNEDAMRAAELAGSAIALDRHNALALATYGHLRSYLFHDYDTALVYFERALTASPNSSLARILYAGTLSYVGRTAEAVQNAEQALRLSPFDQSLFYYYTFLGLAHYANGACEEAVKWTRMSETENPRYTANLRFLIAGLVALNRLDEARRTAEFLLRHEPGFTISGYERTVQPFRDPILKARLLEHLRIAGLPP